MLLGLLRLHKAQHSATSAAVRQLLLCESTASASQDAQQALQKARQKVVKGMRHPAPGAYSAEISAGKQLGPLKQITGQQGLPRCLSRGKLALSPLQQQHDRCC